MPLLQDRSQCPVCHAAVAGGSHFCADCGARLDEAQAEELRGVVYLLSELKDWEAQGLIAVEEAEALRDRYETRREELRAQLASNGDQSKAFSPLLHDSEASQANALTPEATALTAGGAETADAASTSSRPQPAQNSRTPAFALRSRLHASRREAAAASTREARRPLFETLADPYTLRLLLYTGAAMLVVGIVIWLRDVLYLKLQEPTVQAVLLALGTVAVTISGWLMTLRTRLRLTGRALTLIGSLLVPVNFWFLARSGLISNNGRAWMVCALCAALYAHTAALLRERLYVYLSAAASIATVWALVYRATPEAYGLYFLALAAASLIFIHLASGFRLAPQQDEVSKKTAAKKEGARSNNEAAELPRWAYELWGQPLVRVALIGARVSALLYMILRLGSLPKPAAEIFDLLASNYDAGIAMMLFGAGAYISWFTGRYIYTDRRAVLYTTCVLALLWTEFLLLDGLRVSGRTQLLLLSLSALGASLILRLVLEEVAARAVHRATDIVLTLLFLTASAVALLIYFAAPEVQSWRLHILFVQAVAVLYGAVRGWRERSAYGSGLASVAALVFVATLLDALADAGLFPSSWPIAGGVICAAFLLQWSSVRLLQVKDEALANDTRGRAPLSFLNTPSAMIRLVTDSTVIVCAALWFAPVLSLRSEDGYSASGVLLLALLYWTWRAAHERRELFVHLASVHAGAFMLSLLVAVRCEGRWIALAFTLILFPTLFALKMLARARGMGWLARALQIDAGVLTALISLAVIFQAASVLEKGNELLLAQAWTAGALCVVTLLASLLSAGWERVRYFRVGLCAAVAAFLLAVLRAGFDPVIDVEMYTTPVAVLLLIVSYLAVRREWGEYASDTRILLWTGSLLLCGPLLIRAQQFRLLLDLPAPSRDLGVLCAALLLILFGALGRMRAPVIMGMVTLLLELAALALTSVHWLQVPLKIYLITVGLLSLIVWGVFEYRREQLLLLRERLHERRAQARERFGKWK